MFLERMMVIEDRGEARECTCACLCACVWGGGGGGEKGACVRAKEQESIENL